MSLVLQCCLQDRRKVPLTLHTNQAVGGALDSFVAAEKAAGRIKAVPTFWFDGDKLAVGQTPAQLGLEADDVLDVRW